MMEVASAVYHLALGIVKFISEHEDKDALHLQIAGIVVQLQNVVAPLMLRDISDEPLAQVLQSLRDVLATVDGHLRSWKENRARRVYALVNPWAVTQEIREDRVRLMQQYIMLMGAMQVVEHVKGYTLLLPDGADPPTSPAIYEEQTSYDVEEQEATKDISDSDSVTKFWRSCIGNDFEVIEAQQFCRSLSNWLGKPLNDISRKRLLLRLDESNSGHVTFRTLQDLVRDDDMEKVIGVYTADPVFPLLVWISDDIAINRHKVAFAQSKGLCIVQLSTTSSAKAWIKINKKILLKHDTPTDLRFITDQGRRELDAHGVAYTNLSAGEEITRFIRREAGFRAPILVYTTRSNVRLTRYVEEFPLTGSIGSNYATYTRFASALAERRGDDRDWVGVDR